MIKLIKKVLKPPVILMRNLKTLMKIKKILKKKKKLKLVIGASGVCQKGWVPIEQYYLDLTISDSWEMRFKQNSIDVILVEHVWEHLTEREGLIAAKFCYEYLKKGGYMRIAVPDGYHPGKEYHNMIIPGGTGSGADDHKIVYTYDSLSAVFYNAGFRINHLEYFDENGQFHYRAWNREDGMVFRSKRFDERNVDGRLNFTSIIIDAVKD
jgi:predicted SAM-dependent methyltransferase